MNIRSKIKYRKGLKVDSSDWEIVRDTYSLLDPLHDIPKLPRFAFSNEPFLILLDPLGGRELNAGVQRTDDGHKVWWLEWVWNGEKQMHMYPESLQELLFHLDEALFDRRRRKLKQPRKGSA
jgi:hypothetical protein